MRIDFKGKTGGQIDVLAFCAQYNNMLDKNRKVAVAFKAVETCTQYISGGVGNLQEAVDSLEDRVKQVDEKRSEKIYNAGQRFAMFMINTKTTDRQVAEKLKLANADFYNENPWAVPPKPKSFWDKLKSAVSSAFKSIGNAFKKAFNWVADKVKKAWDATVKFIKEHYKTILKVVAGVVIIAGLFALSAVTGGAAAPIFAAAAKAALTAALTSTATSVVSGVAQGKSFGEIFDDAGTSFFNGAVTGAISGAVGTVGGVVLEKTGSVLFSKGAEILCKGAGELVGDFITGGVDYLSKNGTLSGFFGEFGKTAGKKFLSGIAGEALSATAGYLKDWGIQKLGEVFNGLSETGLGKAFNDMVGGFKDMMSSFSDKANSLLSDLGSKLGDLGDFASKLGLDKLSNLTNGLGLDKLDTWIEGLKDPTGFLKDMGGKVLDNVVNNAFGTGDGVNGIPNLIIDKVSGVAKDFISSSGIVDSLNGALGNVLNVGKDIYHNVCGSDLGNMLVNTIKSSFDFKNGISTNVNVGGFQVQVGADTSGLKLMLR